MPPAPQQGGQGDNSTGIIWGVAALFAGLAGVWYGFKDSLVVFYLYMKLYEIKFLQLFSSSSNLDNIHTALINNITNPDKISFANMVALGGFVGDYLRFPFVIVLVILALVVYFGNSTRIFKRIYTMHDLAREEKGNWPQIAAAFSADLIHKDIDSGPWAMAMTPMQFCKRYRLLEELRPQRREGMSRREWDRIEVALKRGEANKVFALQLGPLWRGTDKLPLHLKALFAVFAARINADSKEAAKLLTQLSSSSTTKLDFTGVDELCKKHESTKEVQKILQSHAYIYTVMAAMLEHAREDGVQASADFLWLKPMDRRLWYILNTVGRQTPFVEVAGAFAHWVAEKEAGTKLIVPMVEEATKALERALREIVYKPDEPKAEEVSK